MKGLTYAMRVVITLVIALTIVLALVFMFSDFTEDIKENLGKVLGISGEETQKSILIGRCNTMCTTHCAVPEDSFEWEVDGKSCVEITGNPCDC